MCGTVRTARSRSRAQVRARVHQAAKPLAAPEGRAPRPAFAAHRPTTIPRPYEVAVEASENAATWPRSRLRGSRAAGSRRAEGFPQWSVLETPGVLRARGSDRRGRRDAPE